MQIKTFDEFTLHIDEDAKRKAVNIIRFVNVESLELWVKVKNFLGEKCPNHVRLSNYCADADLVPNINLLQRDLKNIETNTILFPLSEYLRINNENTSSILSKITFLQFINDVCGQNIRLYIPIYKMKNSLYKLLATDERLYGSIIFLEEKCDDDYSLTIIANDLDVQIEGNNIFGLKNYFAYWEDNPSKPIILHTDKALYYKSGLFEENVKVLVTAFDILEHHNFFGHIVHKNWGDDWQWQELLAKLKSSQKIENLFETTFGINKFNDVFLLSQWKDCNDFKRWLIWLWGKFECKRRYLADVLASTESFNELIAFTIEKIFDFDCKSPDYKKIFSERKELLVALDLDELTSGFWDKYKKLKEDEKIYFLTACTRGERVEFIRLVGQKKINPKSKEIVNEACPALLGYLNEFSFENQDFTDYFKEYKVCKLGNQFSVEFINRVSAIASKKGADVWRSLDSRSNLVTEYYDQNTLILFVDNLGVDSIGLIQHALEENYKSVNYIIDVGYVSLPSISEYNKDFMDGRNCKQYKNKILDDLKHAGEYPEYIVDEIDIILDIIKNAVNELGLYAKVIITSDHGSSRGAVIAKGNTYKAKEGAQIERHGRYCIDAKNQYEREIEACFDIDVYHIMGNYGRFSIGGNIKGEIHGGATLEEMLVPVVVLSKSPLEGKASIQLITEEIKPQDNIVKFKVDREYKKLYANVDMKRYECKKEKDYWCFTLEIGRKEEYTVKITSKGNVGEFTVKVKKGRMDNIKFDL